MNYLALSTIIVIFLVVSYLALYRIISILPVANYLALPRIIAILLVASYLALYRIIVIPYNGYNTRCEFFWPCTYYWYIFRCESFGLNDPQGLICR